ncbi:probable cytochrome P450 310a1 [Drosophila albomicans]|uniref:Probable cytochrome P450 310a1 n=1 Tax=Drosophila albomicans TaxID=7291 RepID=A0A6P8W251_DROAB|nr:probable cytochrome P450 310a1 [Drosophila albomicans]
MWLLLPILLYSIVFLYVRHIYSHWRRKGIPSEPATLSWDFLCQAYRREFRHVEAICEAYHEGRDRLHGIYCFFRPVLLVRNVELARHVLQQANGHFMETKWDYVKGYRRFNLLEKLAPMFGTKRLQPMLLNTQDVANQMIHHLQQRELQGVVELDVQQLLRIYAVNIMGNLVYGLDVNNFEQQDHILNSFAENTAQHSNLQCFTLRGVPQKSTLTYRLLDIIQRNVEQREERGIIRKDMLQLLVKFRNGNDLGSDKWQVEHAIEEDKLMSIKRLAQVAEDLLQSALDSLASTITLTLYEIAQQPLIVEKLQAEIKELQSDGDGQLQLLEQLEGMKYMEMCVKETLRKYPPVPLIERTCRKSYTLPATKFTVGEGKTLMIPLLAIQRDEKYFSEPLKYKPLRFLHDKLKQSTQCPSAFVGFGIGGAQCVAQNFAKMVIKVALIKLLQHYDIEWDENAAAVVEVSHLPAPLITSPDGLRLKLKAREILAHSHYRKNSI